MSGATCAAGLRLTRNNGGDVAVLVGLTAGAESWGADPGDEAAGPNSAPFKRGAKVKSVPVPVASCNP